MRQNWNDYERAANRGPLSLAVKIVIGIFALSMLVGALGYVGGWFREAGQVVQEEFGPREALAKYEWFKDASANLDAMKANITAFETSLTTMAEAYENADGTVAPRSQWTREDREAYNQRATEIAGMKAAFNNLAADYNAQMAKFNYRFANQGDLPQGATDPLPREYKPYITR